MYKKRFGKFECCLFENKLTHFLPQNAFNLVKRATSKKQTNEHRFKLSGHFLFNI